MLPAPGWLLGSGQTTSLLRCKLFPAPGKHRRPPPRTPALAEHPLGSRSRAAAAKGGRAATNGLSDPLQGSFPAAESPSCARRFLQRLPRRGTRSMPLLQGAEARGDAVSRRPPPGDNTQEGVLRGVVPRPYLSALVNLRKAWRRSWKER